MAALVALSVVDIRKREIPRRLIWPLLPAALLLSPIWPQHDAAAMVLHGLLMYVPLVILYYVVRGGLGGADVEAFVLAALVTPTLRQLVLLTLVVALTIVVIGMLWKWRSWNTPLPLVPCITVGVVVAVLSG